MTSDNKVYDVLIVGAGPVGLATAIALYTRGIKNILVIDQTRSFRQVGQIVDLLPNGFKSLKVIAEEAYQQIKQTGLNFMQLPKGGPNLWHYKNLQGETLRSIRLDFDHWYERYGEGRISISWYQLQTILRNLLPREMIEINHRCVNFTQTTNSIVIDCLCDTESPANPFAHWEMTATTEVNPVAENLTHKQFEAKLVVAADGINSTLRKLIYTNSDLEPWANPQYSGFSALGCLEIDNVSADLIQQLESQYWQGQRMVTIQADYKELDLVSLILVHRKENSLGYLCHLSLDLELIENQSPPKTVRSVINILKRHNFSPALTEILELSNYEKLIRRPYYIHPANIPVSNPIWSQERLVLVGDAAHGMPPFTAQGANQGLEDAALIGTILSKIIKNNDLDNLAAITQSFNQYEELRRPFMVKVQTGTMENHRWEKQKWESFLNEVYGRDIEEQLCQQK
ncbi:NAD(P)/FAD-dependent oxidoreductase [Gloeocapsa sp. PCC 73106]|uniref:FAD-dependent oxidoreductase n=1 Tax=Gloeocapsa sp. PCC 73106 TaxID=102232 RepID=UPI0002AC360C|nr:NAD(P)/FAD-dependent oxidoreductase [Gloeocapsa sp. PCC 73106]ELR96545.1 2-polyprenyl-6-methoxyphenol hydroxylase-like oxidoreductase [Gloeocapsa sp. PCC 73106]